jgi:dihydrofolate reductase
MRKLVITEFVSLDGIFQAPGPDGSGYKYEGWTFAYSNDEFMEFKTDELRKSDMLLLGRVTYDGFADAWPKRSGDWFSDTFNSMPKYVVSKTLKKATWNNSHIINKNIIEEIKKLKKGSEGNIVVHGSGMLARFLIEEKLADEVTLMVYPVVLGIGKKLFEGMKKTDMKLISEKKFKTGVMVLQYKAV